MKRKKMEQRQISENRYAQRGKKRKLFNQTAVSVGLFS